MAYQIKCSAAYIVIHLLQQKKKKRKMWVRNWILRRCDLGIYETLLSELKSEDPCQLDNFFRMTATDFEHLLEIVGPTITKQDTKMRCAITARERLCVTLRFLATGRFSIETTVIRNYLLKIT